jgi:predicted Zn-dependent protease
VAVAGASLRAKFLLLSALALGILLSCQSTAKAGSGETSIKAKGADVRAAQTPQPQDLGESTKPPAANPESLTARIERELAFAAPSSIAEAERLVTENKAQESEFGRAVLFVAYQLRKRLYPERVPAEARLDPPPLNPLVKVLAEVDKGRYPDQSLRTGRLGSLLAASLLLSAQTPELARSILSDLSRLESEGAVSILIPYLRASQAERTGDWKAAFEEYGKAAALSPECYPARIGQARIYLKQGRRTEAVALLEEVGRAVPNSLAATRLLAQAYYEGGQYAQASPYIQEILRSEPTNDAFIVMRAHILILAGNYLQAGPLLDAYATRNPRDPLYLYLRSLYVWKEQKRRGEALTFIDGALALYPDDSRLSILKAEFLLDSADLSPQDRQSARNILEAELALRPSNPQALILLAKEALSSGGYQRSLGYLDSLLATDPDFRDYALMTEIAFKAKQPKRASAWADEWFAANPDDEYAAIAKTRSLIESGRASQALALVNERLARHPSAKASSVLYYLRSRIQKDQEAALADLRASLMDDPRDLESILAMFDAYFSQKDYKKAQYYLRQAQAVSSSDSEVAVRARNLGSLASQ